MKWLFSSQQSSVHNDLLDQYKRLREVGRDLNMMLVKRLPRDAVPECGKKLGLFKAGTLILSNEDEIAVLYDYCLHHYRRGHKTVIERYLEQSPPAADSLEMTLLQAMTQAHFSVFRVMDTTPGRGAVLMDLVEGETIELIDIALSETARLGSILLGRLLHLPDFHMSSGTLIPVSQSVYQEQIVPIVWKFMPYGRPDRQRPMSATQTAAYVAQMIRVALHAGGMDHVFYTDIEPSG